MLTQFISRAGLWVHPPVLREGEEAKEGWERKIGSSNHNQQILDVFFKDVMSSSSTSYALALGRNFSQFHLDRLSVMDFCILTIQPVVYFKIGNLLGTFQLILKAQFILLYGSLSSTLISEPWSLRTIMRFPYYLEYYDYFLCWHLNLASCVLGKQSTLTPNPTA